MPKEVKIGAMVLIVIAVSVWGYLFLKGQDIFQRSLSLQTTYTDVDQLAVSAPVLVNGVKVGNVTEVKLDPNDIQRVFVMFTLEGITHIPKTAVAELKSTSIMGGKAIVINFEASCTGNGDCLEDGDLLKSQNTGLLGSMLGTDANSYINDAKAKVQGLLNGEGGGETDYAAMLEELKATIENLNVITEKAAGILSASSYDVKNITGNLQSFSKNLEDNNSKVTAILDNLAGVSENIKAVNIDETVTKANSAIDQTTKAVGEIKTTLANTSSAVARVTDVLDKVEKGEGSLGLLVNDKDLYNDLASSSEQISLLLQDLRLNPKRYINVSVFGKKQKEYVNPEDDPAEQQ